MITISKFAQMCNCSVQTLRYYDRQGVLKPFYINEKNGYRYYKIEQKDDFYTIRKFQTIGFNITEIKILLEQTDEFILTKIESKLAEHQDTLNKIIELQKNILKEKNYIATNQII